MQTMFRQAWSRRIASSTTVIHLELATVILIFFTLLTALCSTYCEKLFCYVFITLSLLDTNYYKLVF